MSDELDFTTMYAAHDAFRRDVDRLIAAAGTGLAADPSVRTGWQTFRDQLDIHHRAEDAALWPAMRSRLAAEPGDLSWLDTMEAEHADIDRLLLVVDDLVNAADPDAGELRLQAEALSIALDKHLRDEEEVVLPMIAPAEWQAFVSHIRKKQGFSGAAVFFPWVLDGAPVESQRSLLGGLPFIARFLYKRRWLPSYSKTPRWSVLAH